MNYIIVDGEQYVKVTYGVEQMLECSNDTVRSLTQFVEKFRPNDKELHEALRSLVK
jgi:hypothetical protein